MSVFLSSARLSIPHQRRIDRLVSSMHQDRARLLALEADAGFPARSVCPIKVTITAQRKSLWARILESAGFRPRLA